MRGNAGGFGGGFYTGYAMGRNPEGAGAAAVVAIVLLIGGFAIYSFAVALDKPDREPIANDIVDRSLQSCTNVTENPSLYSSTLKGSLMGVWSSTLEEFTAQNEGTTVCVDDSLNAFVLPYAYNEIGTHYTGEYRVMSILYTHPNGEQALVVKPRSKTTPANTIDAVPDSPLSLSDILKSLNVPQNEAYQHILHDGTTVEVFMQHDAITQKIGSSTTYDNDGKGWADQARMDEVLTHYNFEWPTNKI